MNNSGFHKQAPPNPRKPRPQSQTGFPPRAAARPHFQKPGSRPAPRPPQPERSAKKIPKRLPQNHRTMPPKRPANSPPRPPVPPKKHSRNMVLASVLAALILVTVIIVGVQSCAANRNSSSIVTTAPRAAIAAANKNPEADDDGPSLPTYAEYTDKTAKLSIESEYGILIDLDTNTVLAAKDGDARIYPASMTKIMTMIVAYEHLQNLDETFTFTTEIIDPLYQEGASMAGFDPGETVPYRDLFYGAALPSGGDATAALAIATAGSEEAFAIMMNETVARLGLKDTHFVTASGLHDDNHYSTCHEIAIILEYALTFPELRQILGTYTYTTTATPQHPNGIELYSTMYKRMTGNEAEGVYIQGGKTGYTAEARHCLASFAANCAEETAANTPPRYILVTALAWSEYKPVYDAIDTYEKYCQ